MASGVLPGRKQTPFRAELFACMVAMSISLNAVVYTDCYAVFWGISKLLREGWCELSWLHSPDMDLWRTAWRILYHPTRKLRIVWVESHRTLNQARSALDAWKIYHNSRTDRDASTFANPLPKPILEIHQRLIQQTSQLETLRTQIIFFLKSVWNMHPSKENPADAALQDAM